MYDVWTDQLRIEPFSDQFLVTLVVAATELNQIVRKAEIQLPVCRCDVLADPISAPIIMPRTTVVGQEFINACEGRRIGCSSCQRRGNAFCMIIKPCLQFVSLVLGELADITRDQVITMPSYVT